MTEKELLDAIDTLYYDASMVFLNEWDEVFVIATDRRGMKVTSRLCQSPKGCELAQEFVRQGLEKVRLPYTG